MARAERRIERCSLPRRTLVRCSLRWCGKPRREADTGATDAGRVHPVRLVAAGVSPRVLQLLEMTKVDEFFPRIATDEEADRL